MKRGKKTSPSAESSPSKSAPSEQVIAKETPKPAKKRAPISQRRKSTRKRARKETPPATTVPTTDSEDIFMTNEELKKTLQTFVHNKEEAFAQIQEAVSSQSWLEDEQLAYNLRHMVGSLPELRNEVGICRVFNMDPVSYLQALEDLAYSKVVADPKNNKLLPSKKPLPELSSLKTRQEKAARNKEEQKRNRQERSLREKAQEILAAHDISAQNILQLFLDSMITDEPSPFLGNSCKKQFTLQECAQLILPISHGAHYTVAVIKFSHTAENKTASIQYYDSLGNTLDEAYEQQLEQFFIDKGYQASFECVSEKDQRNEGYNCGYFSLLKGVDIAFKNKGLKERFLTNLNSQNYQQFFNFFRGLGSWILQGSGFNAPLSEELVNSLKEMNGNLYNNLEELSHLYTDILQQVAPIEVEIEDEQSSEQIISRLYELRKTLWKKLEEKLNISSPSETDQTQIYLLVDMLAGWSEALAEAKKEFHPGLLALNPSAVPPLQKSPTATEKNKPAPELNALNFTKIAIYAGSGALALWLGLPYKILIALQLAASIPLTPFYTLLGTGLCFFALRQLANYLDPEGGDKAAEPPLQEEVISEGEDEAEQKENEELLKKSVEDVMSSVPVFAPAFGQVRAEGSVQKPNNVPPPSQLTTNEADPPVTSPLRTSPGKSR